MKLAVLMAVPGIAVALAGCVEEAPTSGRATYADLCAGCHGTSGKGDGPSGTGLAPRPADLTQIAARNGGEYPRIAVMAKIHGYARGTEPHGAMPAFWSLLEGRKVVVDSGDGVLTPTPEPLVELAAYIESLQQTN